MSFDPNIFLEQSFSEANSTKNEPCPAGEFLAVIKKFDLRQWTSKDDATKSGLALDIIWTVEDESVRQALGRTEVTVKQGIMLDLTEAGGLDMSKGKNTNLGRLREAVGLNVAGQPFSFNLLTGQMAKISVKHRPADNGEDVYADVKAVLKAS